MLNLCCRFAKFVHSERFAPRAAVDEAAASPVYIVLLNATKAAAAAAAAASSSTAPAAAAAVVAAAASGSATAAAAARTAATLERSFSGAFDAPGAAAAAQPDAAVLQPAPLEPTIETVCTCGSGNAAELWVCKCCRGICREHQPWDRYRVFVGGLFSECNWFCGSQLSAAGMCTSAPAYQVHSAASKAVRFGEARTRAPVTSRINSEQFVAVKI